MKIRIVLWFCLPAFVPAAAQPQISDTSVVRLALRHTRQVNYQLFDDALQNKRIVLLGELDHGDGSSFQIKTELIRHLHENLGYNTLVFEAGLFNCDRLWAGLQEGREIQTLAKDNIYYIWSEVEETASLFRYIAEQNKRGTPLKVAGMDPQFSGQKGADSFIEIITQKLPLETIRQERFQDFVAEIKLMSTWLHYPGRRAHRMSEGAFHTYADSLQTVILETATPQEKKRWTLYFDNLHVMAAIKWVKRDDSFEKRDLRMFQNLENGLKEMPEEKIIVWAANAHIARKDNALKTGKGDFYLFGLKKLGDHLYEKLPNDIYAIAVTAGSGSTLDFNHPKQVNTIVEFNPGALESYLNEFDLTFVDLKTFESEHRLDTYEAQAYYTNIKGRARWSDHYDGLIYIKKMHPSTPKR